MHVIDHMDLQTILDTSKIISVIRINQDMLSIKHFNKSFHLEIDW